MSFKPLPPGTILSGRYKILSLIRKGGMGAAYRGEDMETQKTVAVKELIDAFHDPEERNAGIGNFLTEMRVLKSLSHPQIPRILDHFVDKRGFFFVLEFVEGEDLTAKLEASGRAGFPEEEVIRTGIHVCRVLDYLHGRQPEPIIHRDIKSSNIMERKRDGRIMVLDFGIAKAADPKQGMMIGTLGYAPPEQHLNRVDARSDIYALGATLHELSTGKRPDEEGFYFPFPNEIRPELSIPFSNVVVTALCYEPEGRFQTARAFEEALQNLLADPVPPLVTDPFLDACRAFSRAFFFPLLADVKRRYVNECQTDTFPETLDYFSFTIGTHVPHSLIVEVSEERRTIRFFTKEGLLSKNLLGEISPVEPDSWERAKGFVDRFLSQYDASTGYNVM